MQKGHEAKLEQFRHISKCFKWYHIATMWNHLANAKLSKTQITNREAAPKRDFAKCWIPGIEIRILVAQLGQYTATETSCAGAAATFLTKSRD